MKRIILGVIFLSGCATHAGVFAEGKDAYLIIISGGHGFASSVDLRIDAHKEAGEFCRGLNKLPETIYEKTTQAGMLSDYPEEELKFRCVTGANVSEIPAVPAVAH